MTNQDPILPKIISAGMDIYYVEEPNLLPHTYSISGKEYHRFCDFILIPDITENLTPNQVIIVNNIRANFFSKYPQFATNLRVRERFRTLIKSWNPSTILEIGPSHSPLISKPSNDIKEVHLAELDVNAIKDLESKNIPCNFFGLDSALQIENNHIDLIFAMFVFQFNVSEKQCQECFRIMKVDGVLIINIYKRSEESKAHLKHVLSSCGFHCISIADNESLCDHHEYWLLYKNDSNKLNELIALLNN